MEKKFDFFVNKLWVYTFSQKLKSFTEFVVFTAEYAYLVHYGMSFETVDNDEINFYSAECDKMQP